MSESVENKPKRKYVRKPRVENPVDNIIENKPKRKYVRKPRVDNLIDSNDTKKISCIENPVDIIGSNIDTKKTSCIENPVDNNIDSNVDTKKKDFIQNPVDNIGSNIVSNDTKKKDFIQNPVDNIDSNIDSNVDSELLLDHRWGFKGEDLSLSPFLFHNQLYLIDHFGNIFSHSLPHSLLFNLFDSL